MAHLEKNQSRCEIAEKTFKFTQEKHNENLISGFEGISASPSISLFDGENRGCFYFIVK